MRRMTHRASHGRIAVSRMLDHPPIYIPSKGRALIAKTPASLDEVGRPYTIIVEDAQHDAYAAVYGEAKLMVLDPKFQEEYETCDDLGMSKPVGAGAARNQAWADSIDKGYDWYWVMDDNIWHFLRMNGNRKVLAGDDLPFRAMEEFARRYRNVAMCGPQYKMFAPARARLKPFVTGTRIYSCNLIRNSVPQRWRGRYNEDTILSLDLLKAGWQTVQFNAFLQNKMTTQLMPGGNTDTLYKDGTTDKSKMLVDVHPDVAEMKWKFGRVHHEVDYRRWLNGPLVPDPTYQPIDLAVKERVVPIPEDELKARRRRSV